MCSECNMPGTPNMCCDDFVALNSEGCASPDRTRMDAVQKTMETRGLCSRNSTCYSLCPDGQFYNFGSCKP